MRGAQPTSSNDARLFAGNPIPALLPPPTVKRFSATFAANFSHASLKINPCHSTTAECALQNGL
jgi:hypothetical protein